MSLCLYDQLVNQEPAVAQHWLVRYAFIITPMLVSDSWESQFKSINLDAGFISLLLFSVLSGIRLMEELWLSYRSYRWAVRYAFWLIAHLLSGSYKLVSAVSPAGIHSWSGLRGVIQACTSVQFHIHSLNAQSQISSYYLLYPVCGIGHSNELCTGRWLWDTGIIDAPFFEIRPNVSSYCIIIYFMNVRA